MDPNVALRNLLKNLIRAEIHGRNAGAPEVGDCIDDAAQCLHALIEWWARAGFPPDQFSLDDWKDELDPTNCLAIRRASRRWQ